MTKQGNEYLLDAEELKTLKAAEEILKKMSHADASDDIRFNAWKALWDVLNPKIQGEDEVEHARRIA